MGSLGVAATLWTKSWKLSGEGAAPPDPLASWKAVSHKLPEPWGAAPPNPLHPRGRSPSCHSDLAAGRDPQRADNQDFGVLINL